MIVNPIAQILKKIKLKKIENIVNTILPYMLYIPEHPHINVTRIMTLFCIRRLTHIVANI